MFVNQQVRIIGTRVPCVDLKGTNLRTNDYIITY